MVNEGDDFYVGTKITNDVLNKFIHIGFPKEVKSGYQVLPQGLGPVSRFNKDGKYIILRHLPKEIKYREMCIKDWHGAYHYVDVPYKRYPRKYVPAPGVELRYVIKEDGPWILSPKQTKGYTPEDWIKHVINLFLEILGNCTILDSSLEPTIVNIPVQRVNWEILPEGDYPWDRNSLLTDGLISHKPNKAHFQMHCLKEISKYKPAGLVRGRGGFNGYLIFRFPEKNIFVMENVIYGNATYVFENNWTQFSKLTKAEIIGNKYQKERIVHRKGWENSICKLLK